MAEFRDYEAQHSSEKQQKQQQIDQLELALSDAQSVNSQLKQVHRESILILYVLFIYIVYSTLSSG